MKNDTIYKGEDIEIGYDAYRLVISKGSGCNLDNEDYENGYVDYFNLDLYSKDDTSEYPSEIGGGMMMLKEYICDTLYGKTIKEVLEFVFGANGEDDYFEIKAKSTPDYVFLEKE